MKKQSTRKATKPAEPSKKKESSKVEKDEMSLDGGGIPNRDLKKNLGC